MDPLDPPRLAMSTIKRALLALVVVVVLCGGATATAGFLQVNELVQVVNDEVNGRVSIDVADELTKGEVGGPRTVMLIGSDRRYADTVGPERVPPRSDTIILVRLDPDKPATSLMSIPRDLQVPYNKRGVTFTDRINRAFSDGGPKATIRKVRDLTGLDINHVVSVNFGGFRRAVDYIGCVYVDIDRRYFNDNSGGGPLYATIDIQPGYQKLCGRDALDYVRYRHEDNDIVRAARQQDFLRQAKDQANIKQRLLGERAELARLFARYTDTDASLRDTGEVLGMLKLLAFSVGKPITEIPFPITEDDESYVYTTPEAMQKAVRRFLEAVPPTKPRGTVKAPARNRRAARAQRRRSPKPAAVVKGLEVAPQVGEDQAIVASFKVPFPVYYPRLRTVGSTYQGDRPRTYSIRDETGTLHRSYRMVIQKGYGEYYGVQGTTWRRPPILDNPSERRRVNGRTFELFYDGRRLRIVAWRTANATYWVSNTLLQSISEKQMLAIAASLRRPGQ